MYREKGKAGEVNHIPDNVTFKQVSRVYDELVAKAKRKLDL